MFSGLKRAFGVITLKIKDDIVHIEGIPADVIRKDISKIWSNRVTNNLFETMDDSSFSFQQFFSLEIYYCIEEILKTEGTNASVRSLTKIKEKLLEETWLKNIDKNFQSKLDMSKLDEFVYQPLPHQIPFFQYYDQTTQQYGLNGVLVAAAAGAAKTSLSLYTMECLNKKTVICVIPANSLYEVWVKTLDTFYKKKQDYWHCKMGTPVPKGKKFYIITYEYLSQFNSQLERVDIENVGIILDESHNFNTAETLRTLSFVDLCKNTNAQDVLWLSGTPIKAVSTEAISLYRTIDKTFNDKVAVRFKKIFGVSSARATDMMAHRLGKSLFIVRKAELKLEEPIRKTLMVTVPNGEEFTLKNITKRMAEYSREREAYYASRRKDDHAYFYGILDTYSNKLKSQEDKLLYDQYRKDVVAIQRAGGDARWCSENMKRANKYEKMSIIPTLSEEDKVKFKDIKSIIKYVKLKIQGEILARVVGSARQAAEVAVAKHINYNDILEYTPKKTLIFTNYVDVVETLKEVLVEQGLDARFVYAKTNAKLPAIIKEFDTKEEVNPLVATYASLSTAVPVTSASGVLLVGSPFREHVLNQSISRAWRIGQDTQITVTTAILDTGNELNIGSRSVQILEFFAKQVEAITGIKSPVTNPDALSELGISLESMEDQYTLSLEDLLDEKISTLEIPISNQPSYMNW